MNDVNIQDGGLETVRKLLQEDKRKLKLVLRRSSKAVERNVNVKVPADSYPMPGIRFAIMASVDGNYSAVNKSNNWNRIQDGDRIDMVITIYTLIFIQIVYIRDLLAYLRSEANTVILIL